jgi:hypothetical protein
MRGSSEEVHFRKLPAQAHVVAILGVSLMFRACMVLIVVMSLDKMYNGMNTF